MKESYKTPTVEEITLCTEQRILDASSIMVIMATTPPDATTDMNMSAGESWGVWE